MAYNTQSSHKTKLIFSWDGYKSNVKIKLGLPWIIFCFDRVLISVMTFVVIRRELCFCLTLLLWIRRSGRSLNAQAAPSNSVMLSCGLLPRNSFAPLRWLLVVLIAIFPTNSRNLEREKPLKNASNRIGNVMWKFTSFLWKLHFSDLLHSRNYFPLMYENSKLRVCIFWAVNSDFLRLSI